MILRLGDIYDKADYLRVISIVAIAQAQDANNEIISYKTMEGDYYFLHHHRYYNNSSYRRNVDSGLKNISLNMNLVICRPAQFIKKRFGYSDHLLFPRSYEQIESVQVIIQGVNCLLALLVVNERSKVDAELTTLATYKIFDEETEWSDVCERFRFSNGYYRGPSLNSGNERTGIKETRNKADDPAPPFAILAILSLLAVIFLN